VGHNHTISYRAFYKTGGSWVAFPGLLRVSPIRVETSGGAGPFAFGAATLPAMTLETTLAGPTTGWYRAPVYAEIKVDIDGVAGSWERVFSGVLLRQAPNTDATGYIFEAGGWDQRIARVRVQTPLRYRRPLATKTTLLSVEDPEDGNYRGGLLNEVFWKAGGRPSEQSITYSSADWYYACDATSVAPEWSWVDGENAWSECLALAEAAGGQIYMDAYGVIRYVNPLRLAEEDPSPPVIADTGPQAAGRILYDGKVQVQIDLESAYNVAVCRYQRRALQPSQEVYNSPYPCPPLQPSGEQVVTIATQWPVRWRDENDAVDYEITVSAVDYAGSPVTVTATVDAESAMGLEVTLTNPIAERVSVTRIVVRGRPVTVVHEGEARYTGARFDANDAEDVERRLEDSIYTQSQGAAERRARLAVLFDGVPRPVYRGLRCPYVAGVNVGGYATYDSARLSLADVPVRIIGKTVEASGAAMVLDVASVAGLRKLSEYWIVGTTYAGADERRIGL
jgi:hypothetical protein